MEKEFDMMIEQNEEEYYVACVPYMREYHTHTKSFDQFMERIKNIIEVSREEQENKFKF